MEDLILKIIDIEDKAQEVIKDAKKARNELDKNIADETKKLHRSIENKALAKSESIKEMELKDAETKCTDLRESSQKNIEALNLKYKENKDAWIDAIVANVIGS